MQKTFMVSSTWTILRFYEPNLILLYIQQYRSTINNYRDHQKYLTK